MRSRFAICIEELAQAMRLDVGNRRRSYERRQRTHPVLFGTRSKTQLAAIAGVGRDSGRIRAHRASSGSDAASLKTTASRKGTSTSSMDEGIQSRTSPSRPLHRVRANRNGGPACGRRGRVSRACRRSRRASRAAVQEDGSQRVADRRAGARGRGACRPPTGWPRKDRVSLWRCGRSIRAASASRDRRLGIAQAAVESRARAHGARSRAGDEFMLAEPGNAVGIGAPARVPRSVAVQPGQPFTRQASMAKLHCTDTAMDLALDGVQLAGEEDFWGSPFERQSATPRRSRSTRVRTSFSE